MRGLVPGRGLGPGLPSQLGARNEIGGTGVGLDYFGGGRTCLTEAS